MSLMNYSPILVALSILLVLILYYSIPGRFQNTLLLLVSYGSITLWNWRFALILLLTTIFHYFYGIWLAHHRQKPLLVFAIVANVLLLLFFRSADFFIPQLIEVLSALGLKVNEATLEIFAPIGLSYYTLQNISYLVDIFRKQASPDTSFVNFALYLSYFPKLLAGPIEYARTFIPRLERDRVIGNEDVSKSIVLILTGLLRKLVIADSLSAAIPVDIFKTPAYFPPIDLFGWLIVYAFVIYNDFAGYTSVVRGISGLFGIELSNNFDYPYFARSFSEFWNRWHISLSRWLRDYIYFPLHRSFSQSFADRNSLLTLCVPPLTTMLASGLWHGLSWHMLLWGGLHGTYLAVERIFSLRRTVIPLDQLPWWRQLISNGMIFVLVILTWVPFRMELPIVIAYWTSMLDVAKLPFFSKRLLLILFYLGLWIIAEWQFYRFKDEFLVTRLPKWGQAICFAVVIVLIIVATADQSGTAFIYQGF